MSHESTYKGRARKSKKRKSRGGLQGGIGKEEKVNKRGTM